MPGLKGKPDRQAFVVKVYTILFFQMFITTVITAMGLYDPSYSHFLKANINGLYWIATIIVISTMISLMCCSHLARTVPVNYILLLIFTLAESYVVASITQFYEPTDVLISAILASTLFVSLTAYAISTDDDLEISAGFCCSFFFVLLSMVVLICIWPSQFLLTMLGALLCALASIYIIYDTKIIAGGGRYELTYDDYIVGALLLYTDLIYLFLQILECFGRRR